jgi:hypothetical protein
LENDQITVRTVAVRLVQDHDVCGVCWPTSLRPAPDSSPGGYSVPHLTLAQR